MTILVAHQGGRQGGQDRQHHLRLRRRAEDSGLPVGGARPPAQQGQQQALCFHRRRRRKAAGASVVLQQGARAEPSQNCVHLDLVNPGLSAVDELVGHGATVVGEHQLPGGTHRWTVM